MKISLDFDFVVTPPCLHWPGVQLRTAGVMTVQMTIETEMTATGNTMMKMIACGGTEKEPVLRQQLKTNPRRTEIFF